MISVVVTGAGGGRPFTGAWIETLVGNPSGAELGRPFTGAWIETSRSGIIHTRPSSPLHGGVD